MLPRAAAIENLVMATRAAPTLAYSNNRSGEVRIGMGRRGRSHPNEIANEG